MVDEDALIKTNKMSLEISTEGMSREQVNELQYTRTELQVTNLILKIMTFIASFPGLPGLQFLITCRARTGESYHVIRGTGDITDSRHEDILTFGNEARIHSGLIPLDTCTSSPPHSLPLPSPPQVSSTPIKASKMYNSPRRSCW